MLKLGRRCNPKLFEGAYKTRANLLAGGIAGPIAIEVLDDHGSYFKFNLNHIAFYNLLTSGDNSWIRARYQFAFDLLRKTTDDHQNAFFDVIDSLINGRNEIRDERIRVGLEEWLTRSRRGFLGGSPAAVSFLQRGRKPVVHRDPGGGAHAHRLSMATEPVSTLWRAVWDDRRGGH